MSQLKPTESKVRVKQPFWVQFVDKRVKSSKFAGKVEHEEVKGHVGPRKRFQDAIPSENKAHKGQRNKSKG